MRTDGVEDEDEDEDEEAEAEVADAADEGLLASTAPIELLDLTY